MKSGLRNSMAVLTGVLAVMSSSSAWAQTQPCNENDQTRGDCPTVPVPAGGGSECSIALPSNRASGTGAGLALTMALGGVGLVLARRKR